MIPFNLQLEFTERLVTISAEQLDQLADEKGYMRYQIRAFNDAAVVFVNIEDDLSPAEEVTGFSEDEVFTPDVIRIIAAGIRQYNSSRKLSFDQMAFDF